MRRLLLTVGMLLMGMALVGGAAVSLVGTSLLPLNQEVGTHSSAAGAVLAWSRALGEFGATITFAGNFPGTTQTAPLAIYIDLESGQLPSAVILSLLLVVVSLAVLVALRGRYLGDA